MKNLLLREKKSLFEIKNKMVDIQSEFPKSESIDNCFCGEILEKGTHLSM